MVDRRQHHAARDPPGFRGTAQRPQPPRGAPPVGPSRRDRAEAARLPRHERCIIDPLPRLERFDVHVVVRAVVPTHICAQGDFFPRLRIDRRPSRPAGTVGVLHQRAGLSHADCFDAFACRLVRRTSRPPPFPAATARTNRRRQKMSPRTRHPPSHHRPKLPRAESHPPFHPSRRLRAARLPHPCQNDQHEQAGRVFRKQREPHQQCANPRPDLRFRTLPRRRAAPTTGLNPPKFRLVIRSGPLPRCLCRLGVPCRTSRVLTFAHAR